jgi:hypothetical protein
VIVDRRLAALLATVHQHVHVGLGIVADRRALRVRRRVAEVLLQQVRVVEQLLQVAADLGQPRRDALALDGGARVGEELVEAVRGVGAHGGLLSRLPRS